MSLQIKLDGRVLHLLLDRPEKRNALNFEMCSRLAAEVHSSGTRDEVGSILISATGSVFSAGMDLAEAAGDIPAVELARVHDDLFTAGAKATKPIIVCVNGSAVGGGLGLVAQGHIVVAAETAIFALREIRLGLWPFLIYRAVETAIGSRRTLELSLTGRDFASAEAQSWGLVHHIAPSMDVLERARSIASEIANSSSLAIAAGMQYFRESRGKSLQESGVIASELRTGLMAGPDFKEGYQAFVEKRAPRWPSIYGAT